jgi:hypothetical protein
MSGRIRLYGTTSGFVELAAPDVADDNVINISELATQSEVNNVISEAIEDLGLASESYVDGAVTGLATESYVDGSVAGLATELYVDGAVAGLATESYVDGAVAGLATESYVDGAVAGLAAESYVDGAVAAVTAASINASPLYFTENVVTANYTLALSDVAKVVAFNSASNLTLTVPANASVAFPVGTVINVYRVGTGTVTIAAASGVTLRNAGTIPAQFGERSLRKRGTNEWVLV